MIRLTRIATALFIIALCAGQAAPTLAACASPHTVQRGDTLYRIALNCGTTVAAIQSANGLSGTTIFVGQQLIIPGGGAAPAAPTITGNTPVSTPAPASASSGTYTVQSGDTLYRIAVKFGTTVDAIKRANGLTSNTIRVGQVLIVSGSGGGAAPAAPTASAAVSAPAAASSASRTGGEKLIIANYFPWYDEGFWGQGATWDLPTVQYNSDHTETIQRHIGWAQQAGLDGFAVHWFQQGNRTDTNLSNVLSNSPGGFRSTVTFLTHILPGANRQMVVDNLRYLIGAYGQHSNFLRINGKPVIFFADMQRVPLEGTSSAVEAWRSIRADVDPGNGAMWIAEGLDPSYLSVFDGLYVYKIDHACCPGSYAKAPTWAGWTRSWEKKTGQTKLWVGTIMPGWDDTRSAGRPDLRVPSAAFARDRQGGSYYQATFNAAIGASPDMIIVHSFNEWIEGSEIEPGTTYGDLYLTLTAQFASQFKGR